MIHSAGPFALIGLIVVGIAVLWARQVAYRNRAGQQRDTMRLVMSITGNLLILVGILGGATHVTFVGPVLISLVLTMVWGSIILCIILMLVMRYRALERRMLLQCIAVAAAKGIPLNQAIRGFANERTDELGYRAAILAESLEAGVSLPEALLRAKTKLPTDALFAMRLGYETGTLDAAVVRVARTDEKTEVVSRTVVEKYLYFGGMLVAAGFCTTFMMLKIAPVLDRMFREFEVELPAITQLNLTVASYCVDYWFVLLPLALVGCVVLLLDALHYVGLWPRDFPGLNLFTWRSDAALLMRALALAVSQSWPLNKTIWLLARIYPKRSIRGRLISAGRHIDNGGDWCDGILRAGLIGRADWAVLKAAQRVGNVEWALEEMAESSLRRMSYRSRLFLNIAFPTVLLLFGLVVAFFVIGFFLPLVSLIQGLA